MSTSATQGGHKDIQQCIHFTYFLCLSLFIPGLFLQLSLSYYSTLRIKPTVTHYCATNCYLYGFLSPSEKWFDTFSDNAAQLYN